MWSEKYRPQIISDMVGNEESRASIMEWFTKWKKGTKPILLVGPPGIGKTTIAYLVAKQFGYDMIGLNASDVRSKSRIWSGYRNNQWYRPYATRPFGFLRETASYHPGRPRTPHFLHNDNRDW